MPEPELRITAAPNLEHRQVQALERIGDLLELKAVRGERLGIRENLARRRDPVMGDYRRTLEARAEALENRRVALQRGLWPGAFRG